MPKLCEFETCRKQASYGEFYGKPIRCKEHKQEYKLVSRLCQNEGCKVQPVYNYEGELTARFCSTHKLENMIDVKSKKCFYENCNTYPTFNFNSEEKPLYCLLHKLDGMVNVKDKKCNREGCKVSPTYNFENEKNPLYCFTHMLEGMIDLKHKKCCYDGCKVRPTFNFNAEEKPEYCFAHKLEGMIDVANKKCCYDGCKVRPTYNFENKKTLLYCISHKLEGMIDLAKNKNKKCIYKECKIMPCYNFENKEKPDYCFAHKLEGMFDLANKNKKCKANFCLGTRGNPKYKGYCTSCYQNLFPNDPLSFQIRSKTKEIAVRDYINSNFEGFQHDKPLWTGNCDCTHRRRIDHRKLIGNTLLCIETDENQHKGYDEKDEKVRYDDLFMLHGGKFIYIRFNPDKFKNKNGKSVNPMLYTRLPILKEEIEKQIKRIENEANFELLEIVKLYYNE
jgi:hypothetical protein